jgi:type III pantothenate kinase
MLLAIDIGNTHTVVGVFNKRKLVADWRVSSTIARTEDEIGVQIRTFLDQAGIKPQALDSIGISSVVPDLNEIYAAMAKKYFRTEPLFVSAKMDIGIKIHYKDPSSVGADRLCNAVAGYEKYGGPLIIIDFGTATTYDVISEKGDYLGGVIAPGIETSAADLHRRAAKLPKIELTFPDAVIGTDTASSMQSGILYGAVDAMEGMVKRIKRVIGKGARVVATGGYSRIMTGYSDTIDSYEPALVLRGVQLICERIGKGKK